MPQYININFELPPTEKDYDFSFVRVIVNGKEIPVKEMSALRMPYGYIGPVGNNEIIKFKNLELIYSLEREYGIISFIRDLNKNCLIIIEDFDPDYSSFFMQHKNFCITTITINNYKKKFYTLK